MAMRRTRPVQGFHAYLAKSVQNRSLFCECCQTESAGLVGSEALCCHAQLPSRLRLCPGFRDGVIGLILDFAQSALKIPLRLLGNALHLEPRIAGQLARFSLRASNYFIQRSVQSIFVHLPTSLDSTVAASKNSLKFITSDPIDSSSLCCVGCAVAVKNNPATSATIRTSKPLMVPSHNVAGRV